MLLFLIQRTMMLLGCQSCTWIFGAGFANPTLKMIRIINLTRVRNTLVECHSKLFRQSEGDSSNTCENVLLFVKIMLVENEHVLKSYSSFLLTPFSEQKLLGK